MCLENLITAILFYDDIVCIDDYEKYRAKRTDYFSFVKWIKPNEMLENDITSYSREKTQQLSLSISSGGIKNSEISDLLKKLGTRITFTWDMASSVYYLTHKIISSPISDIEKDRIVFATLFGQLFDDSKRATTDLRAEVVRRNGKRFFINDDNFTSNLNETEKVTKALEYFIAGLSWLHHRTLYYIQMANYYQADYFGCPIRMEFMDIILAKLSIDYRSLYNTLLHEKTHQSISLVKQIKKYNDPRIIHLEIPFFLYSVMNHVDTPKQAIEYALKLRNSTNFYDARESLRELMVLEEANQNFKQLKKTIMLSKKVEKSLLAIKRKYILESPNSIPLKDVLSMFNFTGFRLPSVPGKIPIPDFLQSRILRRKGLGAVYYNIIDQLAQTQRLGVLKDKLIKNVEIAEKTYSTKIEDEQYLGKSSHWKIPL